MFAVEKRWTYMQPWGLEIQKWKNDGQKVMYTNYFANEFSFEGD
jgi:hypothetical protein